jgi:hypothetical protein
MNEQERAMRFAAGIDRLLEPTAQPAAEETVMLNDDRELLELAHTLARMDLSSQSQFLRRLRQQGNNMQTNFSPSIFQPRRLALVFGVAALILAVALLALPPARALANELWQSLFTRSSSDTYAGGEMESGSVATVVPVAPTQPANVAELSGPAGYQVKEVTYLPPGLSLIGIHYEPERRAVLLFYSENGLLPIVTLQQEPVAQARVSMIGETAVIQAVQIGEIRGEYVRGDWNWANVNVGDSHASLEGGVWNPEDPTQTLSWVDGEIAYSLTTLPGQESGLEMADLIKMAESLR